MNSGRSRVLIVDDDPNNLFTLSKLLGPAYEVLAATSGERALQIAAGMPPPDLILLDVMMPGMDGYDVLSRLLGASATCDIPVIFVTGLDSFEDEEKGLDLGAVDYISKPYRPSIVLARVRTQLELKRARDWLHDQNVLLEAEVERRVAENKLILASAAEGIFGTDAKGVINFVNSAAAAMLGYRPEELVGQMAHAALHHSRPDGTAYAVDDCPLHAAGATTRTHHKEEVIWCRDGAPLPVDLAMMPMRRGDEILGSVTSFTDIRERQRYMEQLERKSNYDDLTGLPNRNLLTDRLAHALDRCEREAAGLAVLLVNIDRFKEINDSLGYEAGDRLLVDLSRRLGTLLLEADTLARSGGDEFVALVDGEESAAQLASAVLQSVTQPLPIGGNEVSLSASIGIAVFPKDGQDGGALLQNAAAAMYKAKATAGNAFRFYAAEMNARSMERLELENALRRALERKELLLHYQPQLSLRNGEIIGCEALLRWRHPTYGLMPPGKFIPLAEETGLIVSLGEWVLRTAAAQNKAWQESGLPAITVAVNMSPRQFAAQDVVALARTILKETGLDPNTLELELTESAVMADAESFIRATEDLKGLHVTLSIDDFGTGFSSLSYLKRFALDRLKIDISFVRDITHDPNSASIALAIISLAHSLKLSVIAEGVETEGHLNFLHTRGCDEMQGYYFSPPVPAAEFEQMLREGRKLVFPGGAEAAVQTLLLVDDEAAVLSSLTRLLRREGYKVLTAESGEAGLELMAIQEVGVVVSDARMRHMDGAEFLDKVRRLYPNTIRIMLSGYTDLRAVTAAVNKGELFMFLTKPWDNDELLESIGEAFRQYELRRRQPLELSQVTPTPIQM